MGDTVSLGGGGRGRRDTKGHSNAQESVLRRSGDREGSPSSLHRAGRAQGPQGDDGQGD